MRLRPVPYMAWAKAHLESAGIHNLGSSGIRRLIDPADLDYRVLDLMGETPNADGLPALREAIAARYRLDPARVLVGEGTSLANFLVYAAWIRPGDPVLLEEPHYEPLRCVLEALDARIHPVAVDGPDGHGRMLDLLRSGRGARWRAAVVTHPHNPTGIEIGADRMRALGAACAEQGAILFVDEAYREILLEDPPGCAAHEGESIVVTSSLTKVFGLSHLRAGWAAGPRTLIDRAARLNDNLGVVHPYITEALSARIYADSRKMGRWRDLVARRMEENRRMLSEFLLRRAGIFEGGMAARGILAFPRVRPSAAVPDAETLCRRARDEANVVVVPGRFFQRPSHVRLAVGGPSEDVAASLDAFDRYLESIGASTASGGA